MIKSWDGYECDGQMNIEDVEKNTEVEDLINNFKKKVKCEAVDSCIQILRDAIAKGNSTKDYIAALKKMEALK